MTALIITLICTCTALCQETVRMDTLVSEGSGMLRRPTAIAVGVDGTIYVADTGNHRLVALDSTGSILFESSGGGSTGELRWPVDVAVGAAGKVFVADAGNRRIVEYSRLLEWRGELIIADTDGEAREPRAITANAAGDLYVYESDGGELRRYDGFGAITARTGGQSGQIQMTPRDLSVSTEGEVFWADTRDGRVYQSDAMLSAPRLYSEPRAGALRVAATDSVLYILADSALVRIHMSASSGNPSERSAMQIGNALDFDIAARTAGQIYLLDTRRGAVLRVRW